ncbi:subunits of heterodimeric actin filament capping protein Capz [Penicillium lagena]|uniref:subunits of heterodimeric actin filament capping protein Capz n=1 Tax=Penicillium lagena TaxID=94218 RepID=UPI0025406B5B|nr:subunits of heterodimeric actin filament capping protein Capz [Penicillium lagena]KAJ5604382.1 subunits of heterodimeric actin filament capping protein Capz [Penicillium lagena]
MASTVELASSFIEGAPPGEVCNSPPRSHYPHSWLSPPRLADPDLFSLRMSLPVIGLPLDLFSSLPRRTVYLACSLRSPRAKLNAATDVQALTSEGENIIPSLASAFERYNESQLTTVKLPGSSQEVGEFNKLEGNRYFDTESQTSFEVDHTTQTASGAQSSPLESQNADLIKSLLKSLGVHAREHYPSCSYGVYPIENDSTVAIVLVANRYSPNNFWNGRFRAIYQVPVSSTSTTVTGKIHVDVHYYEDGNVSLNTTKPINVAVPSVSAESIISRIATAERDYQEDLNRAFVQMAEGAFKNLRRQLPITRQKVEWEKVGGYRGIFNPRSLPHRIQPPPHSSKMIHQFTRFVNCTAGLDKTLRLFQALAQIAAVFSVGTLAVQFTTAKLQLALTRRFLRLFGFIPSFQRVAALLSEDGVGSMPIWLEMAKCTSFGLYIVLEDLTILHATGVHPVPWNNRILREAFQFWFYALALSVARSSWCLLFTSSKPAETTRPAKDQKQQKDEDEKKKKKKPCASAAAPLMKQLVADSCDLLLPGSLLGWIPVGDLAVGVSTVVSTLITGQQVWVAQNQ